MTGRRLTDEDAEPAWRLSQLAFGWRGDEPPSTLDGRTVVGLDGPDGLVAMAGLRSYEQWWGGRPVAMGGVAGVAVRPEARGRGAARAVLNELIALMRERGQPISVLFPTAPGIYRALGWEIVGSQDDTVIPTASLRRAPAATAAATRPATPGDVPAVAALYAGYGASADGLLVRTGPEFPRGADAVLEHDVVTVAELDGRPAGYVSYNRGSGYVGSELRVWELVAERPAAALALVGSVGSWDAVAATVRWRGPTDELALLLPVPVPPPAARTPWMLRIVDAPAAVAARGMGADAQSAFELVDPVVRQHSRSWRLTVRDGAGRLEPASAKALPQLHVRGLALLYAGVDSATVVRVGLLDRPLQALDGAFGGQRPRILDYF